MPPQSGRHNNCRSGDPVRGRQPFRFEDGQALVEFSLVLPLFLILLLSVLEFGFAFNALLSVNYASRDAALTAAEAGNMTNGDCHVLRTIEADVSSPADRGQINQVEIAWTDANGTVKVVSGTPKVNRWTRSGSTICTITGIAPFTIPYTLAATDYPSTERCSNLQGCPLLPGHSPSVDTIAVRITYTYPLKTPLRNFIGTLGATGGSYVFTQSNAMRMEPVL